MVSILKKTLSCFYHALVDTIRHDGVEHAGYMAFLSMLSLFPFLVLLFAIVGNIEASAISTEFVKLLLSNLPVRVSEAIRPRIQEIISGPPQGLLTLAIVGATWTASSAVEGLRTILNRAHRVATPPSYILRRFLSIVQFLIITAIIIIAMGGLIVLPLIIEHLSMFLHLSKLFEPVWVYIRYMIISSLLFFGIASLYYTLPNTPLSWRSVIPGTIVVVILWLISGLLFSSYLSHFQQVNLIYGSLGGIIVALLFFYILNLIFIYGAELNYLLQEKFHYHTIKTIE